MKPAADDPFIRALSRSFWALAGLVVVAVGLLSIALVYQWRTAHPPAAEPVALAVQAPRDTNFVNLWTPPSDWRLTRLSTQEQAQVRYGRGLITHTADYLGPQGSVAHLSNGMNCQNFPLRGGPTQRRYAALGQQLRGCAGTYPKFRERSGTVEDQVKRVNDCFQRSLNGRPLDLDSREMGAILAYIKWLGSDVPPQKIPRGSGLFNVKGDPVDRLCRMKGVTEGKNTTASLHSVMKEYLTAFSPHF